MKILAIDTACDETSVAVTTGRQVLSTAQFSQVVLHKQWGGVVPIIAKRAQEEHIQPTIEMALKRARVSLDDIETIAVTFGPGLAIALGVGIDNAKELATAHHKKLIAVNHMEGHIYSCFAQNSKGNPDFEFKFPYLVLLVSGGHTELVLMKDHGQYEVIGKTLDDAVGEALDKAARIIVDEMVYPGGPIIERLALQGNDTFIHFTRPMARSNNLHMSYSGLKTALFNTVRGMSDQERVRHMHDLAASFQQAAFDELVMKLEKAMKKYKIYWVVMGGGVSANIHLRKMVRKLVQRYHGKAFFPTSPKLYGDNAAMIGVAAHFHAQRGDFVDTIDSLERNARAGL